MYISHSYCENNILYSGDDCSSSRIIYRNNCSFVWHPIVFIVQSSSITIEPKLFLKSIFSNFVYMIVINCSKIYFQTIINCWGWSWEVRFVSSVIRYPPVIISKTRNWIKFESFVTKLNAAVLYNTRNKTKFLYTLFTDVY